MKTRCSNYFDCWNKIMCFSCFAPTGRYVVTNNKFLVDRILGDFLFSFSKWISINRRWSRVRWQPYGVWDIWKCLRSFSMYVQRLDTMSYSEIGTSSGQVICVSRYFEFVVILARRKRLDKLSILSLWTFASIVPLVLKIRNIHFFCVQSPFQLH